MNILVVGAGFAGATVARHLAENGFNVFVIDKRDHVAGNAYDVWTEFNILKHQYGPHIFHTNNYEVFNWLSRFTEWVPYKHKVLGLLDNGEFVVIPPNLDTLSKLGGKEEVVNVLFRPYTLKMWGVPLENLSPDIVNRVQIREDRNELYFPDDAFQFLPKFGYTKLIENVLDHPNISISLDTAYEKSFLNEFSHVFSSQPIDEFFDYSLGPLPYRSIKFHDVFIPHPQVNSVPTVNFTHNGPYTRVTEWKNFPGHGFNVLGSLLTFEEPCDYIDNSFERYYPVKDLHGMNRERYYGYKSLVPDNVTFIGRLGLYVYMDMHQAVNSSLAIARSFVKSYS